MPNTKPEQTEAEKLAHQENNRQKALDALSDIQKSSNSVSSLREQVGLIEYGLIKDFDKKYPEASIVGKTKSSKNEGEQQDIASFLSHVVNLPVGHTAAASTHLAKTIEQKVRIATNHIERGGNVSDKMLGVLIDSVKDTDQLADNLTNRLDNYNNGVIENGMVDVEKMEANHLAGKKVYKSSALVMGYAQDAVGKLRPVVSDRIQGIQGDFASHNNPTTDPTFSVGSGNPITAKEVIYVIGDLPNLAVDKNSETPYKVKTITDDFEAANLAHLLDVNQKNYNGADIAVVTTSVSSFNAVYNMLTDKNPNAKTSVYTDTQGHFIQETNKFGETNVIPPAPMHALNVLRRNIRSEEDMKNHTLMIKTSEASLADQLEDFSRYANESIPDNKYQAERLQKDLESVMINDLNEQGLVIARPLLESYKGSNINNTVDDATQLSRDSRMNTSLNRGAGEIESKPSQSNQDTSRQTIANDHQETPRVAAPMR